MNKTININLAGLSFFIDEDAYIKLNRYLETIKRSFTNSQGRDEIIADIEARIAELFAERMVNERHVINTENVNEVIAIMGQPEDYAVDEEIFEDEPYTQRKSRGTKQLLRDPDNKYIAGVSSGLSYYLGIDPVWIRLLWVLLVIAAAGSPILVYIILWIVMPEAKTTAQKLAMKGEPVNVSNIERKVKEGFDDVAQKVKNVDYEKVGNKVKDGTQTFIEAIGNVILSILKVFGKFFGVIIILISSLMLISLLISLFALGSSSFFTFPQFERMQLYFLSGMPIWVFSLIIFFALGVPVFFLFILGLKIVANNVKSIGNVANFSLLGLWIVSILGLIFFGLQKAAENSTQSTSTVREDLIINTTDTLYISRIQDHLFENKYSNEGGLDFVEEKGINKALMSNVHFNIRPTNDSIGYIKIEKISRGGNIEEAKTRAKSIEYSYSFNNNTILLNDYFLSTFDTGFREQRVFFTLYLPENTIVALDKSVKYMLYDVDNDFNIYDRDMPNYKWRIGKNELKCLNCETMLELEEQHDDLEEIPLSEKKVTTQDKDKLLEVEKVKVTDSLP